MKAILHGPCILGIDTGGVCNFDGDREAIIIHHNKSWSKYQGEKQKQKITSYGE